MNLVQLAMIALAAIDLGNAPDFGNEPANMQRRRFTFNFTSTSATTQQVLLNPSYIPSVSGRTVATGTVYTDGDSNTVTCASADGRTIENFLKTVARFPCRVLAIQFDSNTSNQLNQSLTVQEKRFFDGNPEPIVYGLADYKNAGNPNDKLVNVKFSKAVPLDDETEISLVLAPRVSSTVAATVSVTVYVGAYWNPNKALDTIANLELQDPAQAAQYARIMGGK